MVPIAPPTLEQRRNPCRVHDQPVLDGASGELTHFELLVYADRFQFGLDDRLHEEAPVVLEEDEDIVRLHLRRIENGHLRWAIFSDALRCDLFGRRESSTAPQREYRSEVARRESSSEARCTVGPRHGLRDAVPALGTPWAPVHALTDSDLYAIELLEHQGFVAEDFSLQEPLRTIQPRFDFRHH